MNNIVTIPVEDNISFAVSRFLQIMLESRNPGVRVAMSASLGKMSVPLRMDISTGDVITPGAVDYEYGLMFEDRSIQLKTYNLETVLAEKFDTILSLHVDGTRMRDFYDVHTPLILRGAAIDRSTLSNALVATMRHKHSYLLVQDLNQVLNEIENDNDMSSRWSEYAMKSTIASRLGWHEVVTSVRKVAEVLSDAPTV